MYSSKGDRLLFVSGQRRAHSQPQVYEYYLDQKTDRRITFQDGHTFQPRYHPQEEQIVYSSTTDELKDYSRLLNPVSPTAKKPEPFSYAMEVYLHALEGLEIIRLTRRQGFDGEARFSADGAGLTWTQVTPKGMSVVAWNRRTQALRPISAGGKQASNYSTAPSGDQRAWLEWDKELTTAQVHWQKDKVKLAITTDTTAKADLTFSPDAKWLLWAARPANSITDTYDLWLYDFEKGCARQVTKSLASERDPTLSPDMKWLTYTKVTQTRSRIMRMAFKPPSGACP